MDPFSDIISLVRPHAAISKPITGSGDWGISYEAYGQPGFAMVLMGQCWLALDGGAPVLLRQGDFVLLPATPAFTLSSQPDADCKPMRPSDQPVHHGNLDGTPDVELLGGAFRIDEVNAQLLLELLPRLIHIRSADTHSLSRIMTLIAEECRQQRPGREIILPRLLEVLLVDCLRHGEIDVAPAGLFAGLRDLKLAVPLRAIHGDVRFNWTVARLAELAAMSRSSFSALFVERMGCGPIEYLSRWRMALARDALAQGDISLDRLADAIGYESASAFSTAFRRRVGCAPGAFARSRRAMSEAARVNP